MSLTTPSSVQKLQTALHAKAKEAPDFRVPAHRTGLAGFRIRLSENFEKNGDAPTPTFSVRASSFPGAIRV